MKTKIIAIALIAGTLCGLSQSFVNLNFESANLTGYSPGSNVPTNAAIPGWTASSESSLGGTNADATIVYDEISTGGPFISIVDTNVGFSYFYPIQGRYSVFLFGASGVSSTISQTGLVPAGTDTLLFDANASSATFIVTLGGQTITLIPLQVFSYYTLYGADISSFADSIETLSFTEPPAPVGQPGGDPNIFELDNIQFSSSPVPEPSALGLSALGGLFLAWRRWKARAI
jgi:hypothetical protein